MTEFAIVKDNLVLTRIVAGRAFAEKLALELGGVVSASVNAQRGSRKEGSVFRPIDNRTAAEKLKEKKVEIQTRFSEDLETLNGDSSAPERGTWRTQYAEAKAFKADSSSPTPMIDAIVTEGTRSKTAVINGIISKVEAYNIGIGEAIGRKDKALANLNN